MQDKEKIRLQELAHKYLNGTITSVEQQEFDNWFEEVNDEPLTVFSSGPVTEQEHKTQIFNKITETLQSNKKKTKRFWSTGLAAASVFLCFGIAAYVHFHKSPEARLAINKMKDPIQPGGQKAYLTLANGKRIVLTNAANGKLAEESGVQVSKTAEGELIYTITGNSKSQSSLAFNTIETPRGGQYQIRLPDGTQVWLNSASSLKYPISFESQPTRRVMLQGEAYFEVTKNKKVPFIVDIKDKQEVKVLGTHFNIMAYSDEPMLETTLMEGSVEVSHNNHKNILKPGQQSSIQPGGEMHILDNIDLNSVIAWKNGKIFFEGQDIRSIMRQISRWYNVEVEYHGNIPKRSFTGAISRDASLSELLEILKLSKVHFRIENRTIIVTP
ncbi:hypothetical protein DBR11_21645 [Pedobacter sp. HMWF019]|uniref:FecR family protein n=1 Tax=Pedobacter sp. HMWF019 TaxID=2056856 RepID=UPI000D364660|nr:FecR family protein [Pedobacter sp. HMWF019]PTS95204.1 hypothetical protein DBR11_21645 [Pedobacter sp. HMWF019]